jgi:hypothetical protein
MTAGGTRSDLLSTRTTSRRQTCPQAIVEVKYGLEITADGCKLSADGCELTCPRIIVEVIDGLRHGRAFHIFAHPAVERFDSFCFIFVSFCFIFVSFLFHFCFIFVSLLFHFCFIFVSFLFHFCFISLPAGVYSPPLQSPQWLSDTPKQGNGAGACGHPPPMGVK